MIHKELEILNPLFLTTARVTLDLMRSDSIIKKAGYGIVVLETLRDLPVQMAYYARGRMAPADVWAMWQAAGLWLLSEAETRKMITWTLASKHLAGLAFDAAPTKDGRVPAWDAPEAVWERMAEIAEGMGLRAGRHFPDKKKDSPHFEAA